VKEVGVCSQQIRKSPLLRKCISTALAVGNTLNRGTSRSGVRGVVLPESLLKLDELRGLPPAGTSASDGGADGGERLGGSVLDFIAQAIVNEEGADNLQQKAESLLAKTKMASAVSLEESEASFRQLHDEATKTQQALSEVPDSPGITKITGRVNLICEEINCGLQLSRDVKADLAKTQQWSCCKGTVKSDDWFATWAQFLELLSRALGRAQEAKARFQEEKKRAAQEEMATAAKEPLHVAASKQTDANSSDVKAKESSNIGGGSRPPLHAVSPAANMDTIGANAEVCGLGAQQPDTIGDDRKPGSSMISNSKAKARSNSRGCLLDDDAKMPDLSTVNWSQMGNSAQISCSGSWDSGCKLGNGAQSLFARAADKENSCT